MHILLLGGTGLIGTKLTEQLITKKHTVTIFSRNPKKYEGRFPANVSLVEWHGNLSLLTKHIEETDCIVNLLGENLANKRWTTAQKEKIYSSRITIGEQLVEAIQQSSNKPKVFIQASAVGYYPPVYDISTAVPNTEESLPGNTFLSNLTIDWEASTEKLELMGIRRAIIRTSPVLSNTGGILPCILPPFKCYLGGYPATGKQPFPWIHIDDEVGAIIHLIENTESIGVYNLIAPESATVKTFCITLASVLNKPCYFTIPAWFLRMLIGKDLAEELILAGHYATPTKLEKEGFTFLFPSLEKALENLLHK